jgi:hypothetical protein
MNVIPDWYAALAVAALVGTGALMTSGPLAVVGWLRAERHRFWNGVWHFTWSIALSAAIMAVCLLLHLGWLMTVLDCAVLWSLAWFLLPRERRARILHHPNIGQPPDPQPPMYPQPAYPQPPYPQQQLHAQQYAGWPR